MRRTLIIAATIVLLASCQKRYEQSGVAEATGGGSPDRGKQLIAQYGCQACHTIPGIPGPKGVVGPPLNRMAVRGYIAGKVPNTPANMIQWIQNPASIDPGNAMPALGVTPTDAKDITAYLFTLK